MRSQYIPQDGYFPTAKELKSMYHQGHEKTILKQTSGDKALELWKRLFEERTNPYESFVFSDGEVENYFCFFCGSFDFQSHAPNCIWVEAKKLVEENKE